MNGKDEWNLGSDCVNGAEEFGEFFGGVNIRRTMQSEDTKAVPVGTVLQSQIFADGGAGANFEIRVRRGNSHLAEENVGESCIVVLAGMDEDVIDLRVALHFARQRRDLRRLG